MLLREDLLTPIPGEKPAGTELRYDPIYDKIRELRKEDDGQSIVGSLAEGAKTADWPGVIGLTQDTIASRSKDLQLSVWLTEALIRYYGFEGFAEGVKLSKTLLESFWEGLYPLPDEGDLAQRCAPLHWLGSKMDVAIKSVPLCRDGHGFYAYKASRSVGYETDAKTKEQKLARDKSLKEGKLAPEIFDKSFGETPKSFYAKAEKDLDACLSNLTHLDAACQERFTDESPAFGKLKTALEEVRQVVHGLLQKKREVEPDAVEDTSPEPQTAAQQGAASQDATPVPVRNGVPPPPTAGSFDNWALHLQAEREPADRAEAIASIAAAAAFLRKREPGSPAPYLMLRGLRWGELRASFDPMALDAPPTELRQRIRLLASQNNWRDLLETAENAMSLPCSRAWLDLQRMVVEACVALGEQYFSIAVAIRSELRALLRDLPQLLDTVLNDDTPAANPDTQIWLRELVAEPADTPQNPKLVSAPTLDGNHEPGWRKKFIDAHTLAIDALRTGQAQRAIDILAEELARQRSGRGKFQRKLQLAQMCVAAGKDAIAQPLLDDLSSVIETHKLEDWEDAEFVAGALAFLVQASKKVQADAKVKALLFDRVCRLDPVKAMELT